MNGGMQVYRISRSNELKALKSFLSIEELQKAAAFYFRSDRQLFITAHAALRLILAQITGRAPQDLVFTIGAYGKPGLPGIEFSMSHSGDTVLIALGETPLGVDIERIQDLDPNELAPSYFSSAERRALESVEPSRRLQAFFECWTRKEAFIKATGEGLFRSLTHFDVSVDARAQLLATRPDSSEAVQWQMVDLSVGSGYAGTLCFKIGASSTVSLSDFDILSSARALGARI